MSKLNAKHPNLMSICSLLTERFQFTCQHCTLKPLGNLLKNFSMGNKDIGVVSIEAANTGCSVEFAMSMQQSRKTDPQRYLILLLEYLIMPRSLCSKRSIVVASSLRCLMCICPHSFIQYAIELIK